MPFFRRWEGSLYAGWFCANVGVGIAGVVSSLVNKELTQDLGLGLIGMTFGLLNRQFFFAQIRSIIVEHG